MKKRLSSFETIISLVVGLSGVILSLVFTYGFRLVATPQSYSLVRTKLPLLELKVKDPVGDFYVYPKTNAITDSSLAIVMSLDRFVFGTLFSISHKYLDATDKIQVPYINSKPNLDLLFEAIDIWKEKKGIKENFNTDVCVLVAHSQLPLSVVIQVLHYLQKSQMFQQVVLGGELI